MSHWQALLLPSIRYAAECGRRCCCTQKRLLPSPFHRAFRQHTGEADRAAGGGSWRRSLSGDARCTAVGKIVMQGRMTTMYPHNCLGTHVRERGMSSTPDREVVVDTLRECEILQTRTRTTGQGWWWRRWPRTRRAEDLQTKVPAHCSSPTPEPTLASTAAPRALRMMHCDEDLDRA